ncbi:MAG TPA: 5'/3'-nucleotidase SurE [Bacteroidales bacterium]|nr:5'/3'-nucleotidase SurE [Bacteroidales bacterium]
MMTRKPLILVTNDDGVAAPGIRFLISVMRELGEVVVLAPDKPQSGMGHAITVSSPLRMQKLTVADFYKEYSCSGTPVDCVKLAVDKILHRKPDLLVSGINHGLNSSVNIIYSETMSGDLEGAMVDIPSAGFSLDDYAYHADFSHTAEYIKVICRNLLHHGLPPKTCLNVNFPKNVKKLKGIKVCRQANAYWKEEFNERKDPHGRNYYWLTGIFENTDKGKDTDEWALRNNYVSVVPVHVDFTAHHAIPVIKKWKYNV